MELTTNETMEGMKEATMKELLERVEPLVRQWVEVEKAYIAFDSLDGILDHPEMLRCALEQADGIARKKVHEALSEALQLPELIRKAREEEAESRRQVKVVVKPKRRSARSEAHWQRFLAGKA
jgi:superfamily I DNA and RNA helicase